MWVAHADGSRWDKKDVDCTLRRLSLGQEGRGRPSPTAISGSKGTWATLSTGPRWDKQAVGCPIHRLSQGQEGRGVHSQTALAGTGGRGLHSPTALAGTRRMWAALSVGTRWDLDGEKVWAAVEERLRAVRTMAGTDWGCHRGTLRTLWIAQGQSKTDHELEVYGNGASAQSIQQLAVQEHRAAQ